MLQLQVSRLALTRSRVPCGRAGAWNFKGLPTVSCDSQWGPIVGNSCVTKSLTNGAKRVVYFVDAEGAASLDAQEEWHRRFLP